jgi:hypothetical protein
VPKPLAVVPDLEDELDRLFGLPPGEFTAARNDLARRMKQAGQNAIAARVRELKKPTVAVWTVNQLARAYAKEVEALLGAAERLRTAQEEAIGGGDTAALRSATAAERKALRTLTQKASDILAAAGHTPTPAVLDRIASTLRAAAVDPGARDVVAAGRLTEELESTGFGALAGMKVPKGATRPARPEAQKRTGAAGERRRKERLRKLQERLRKLTSEAEAAEHEAERAGAVAEKARRSADRARAAAERARAELEAAEHDEPD